MAEMVGSMAVSRAATKLTHAIDVFGIQVDGWVCADFGCNAGGFTEVMLQRGAAKVYAIDTGYGALDWNLRKDPRVVVMERTNAIHVNLPERIDLVTIDVAWTRQRHILPAAMRAIRGNEPVGGGSPGGSQGEKGTQDEMGTSLISPPLPTADKEGTSLIIPSQSAVETAGEKGTSLIISSPSAVETETSPIAAKSLAGEGTAGSSSGSNVQSQEEISGASTSRSASASQGNSLKQESEISDVPFGGGRVISLIKPHYEAHARQLRAGVLRLEEMPAVLDQVKQDITAAGFEILGWTQSPIKGAKGNVEFLALLRCRPVAPAR